MIWGRVKYPLDFLQWPSSIVLRVIEKLLQITPEHSYFILPTTHTTHALVPQIPR